MSLILLVVLLSFIDPHSQIFVLVHHIYLYVLHELHAVGGQQATLEVVPDALARAVHLESAVFFRVQGHFVVVKSSDSQHRITQ
uniref:Putative secreted protein n=1 Tax=Ixodes ricinus TaxID=34613 RepID=A0A6B0U007_IXORI